MSAGREPFRRPDARFRVPGDRVVVSGREAIRRAARWLLEGGLLAHPTSTVYGLGGRPDPELDRAIAEVKGRDAGRPLLRVAASRAAAEALLPPGVWSAAARTLADRFWPGPLTLVLPDGSETGLGFRVDPHPVLRALLEEAGTMMSSTSLNATGAPPVRRVDDARAFVDRRARDARPALLDAGDLPPSAPSTIVSLLGTEPALLREGAVPWNEIVTALEDARRMSAR